MHRFCESKAFHGRSRHHQRDVRFESEDDRSTSDQCPPLPSKAGITLRSYGSRGPEFNDGNEGNQNKDGQHDGLRDREGWLSLSRR